MSVGQVFAVHPSDVMEPSTTKELAQKAVQANKDHYNALKLYTERLEAELEAVDKLLVRCSLSFRAANLVSVVS